MINNQDAQQVVALENRYRQICSEFLEIFGTVRIFRVSQVIGNMDRSAFKASAASSAISAEPNWISGSKILKLLRSVEGAHHPQKLTIEAVYERPVGSTQSDRAFGDGFKHRLKIERGAADD